MSEYLFVTASIHFIFWYVAIEYNCINMCRPSNWIVKREFKYEHEVNQLLIIYVVITLVSFFCVCVCVLSFNNLKFRFDTQDDC